MSVSEQQITLKLDHSDLINLLFCLLYTKGIIEDKNPNFPLKEYREQLTKWIDLMVEDFRIQEEFKQ